MSELYHEPTITNQTNIIMINIKFKEEIQPIDLGTYGLDKNHIVIRSVHFLGIKVWSYNYNRKLHMDEFKVDKKISKAGFRET